MERKMDYIITGIKKIVAERDTYKQLLDECLYALNTLPMQKIPDGDGGDTYKLAVKIEKAFIAMRG